MIDGSPVCIDEFLPFQIPETWIWCKVKDLLEIQTGASFKKEQANANKKGIRILRGGNILPNKYIFKDDDVFVSEEFVNANTCLLYTSHAIDNDEQAILYGRRAVALRVSIEAINSLNKDELQRLDRKLMEIVSEDMPRQQHGLHR